MIEHGNYQVEVVDDLIMVTFDGMFNEVASKKLCSIVENHIIDLNGAGFYMLIDLRNYHGSTREAHEEGNRHAMWLETQHCLGKAVVTNQQAMLEIVRNEQDFLNKSKITTRVFASEAEAKAWLTAVRKDI